MDRVTIALPKGRMAVDCYELLAKAGYPLAGSAENGRRLRLTAADGPVDYLLAKPSDVPVYVEYGAADLGIVGLEALRESGRDVFEPLLLPFGYCRLCVAGMRERPARPLRLEPSPRIATKYPRLAAAYFRQRGISAEIIPLSGSVELGPLVGLADLIVDVVESGKTLQENGLVEIRTIMHSQAVLIANRASYRTKAHSVSEVIRHLRDVVQRRVQQIEGTEQP